VPAVAAATWPVMRMLDLLIVHASKAGRVASRFMLEMLPRGIMQPNRENFRLDNRSNLIE
jgi:hypothetical protein